MTKFQECYDEYNPRTECIDKVQGKGCVEPGMGGHPGAFTDVQLDNCKIACGKKASKDSKTELAFYDDLYSRDDLPENLEALKNFIPKYYAGEKCSKKDNGYFVIENIKSGIGSDVRTLDFKIGFKTAFGFDSGSFKRHRHGVIDSDPVSTSEKRGYRLEGATGPEHFLEKVVASAKDDDKSGYKWSLLQRGKKKLQSALYHLSPDFIFSKFFQSKKQVQDIARELNDLKDEFIYPSKRVETTGGETIAFIGSSILFVIGDKGGTFKLIDFAHPLWNNPEMKCCKSVKPKNHKKALDNYLDGLLNFIKDFETWREINYKNLPDVPDEELTPIENIIPQSAGKRKKRTRRRRRKKRTKKKARKKRRKTRRRRRKNKY